MRLRSSWITGLALVGILVGGTRVSLADHDVEHRIAQFWSRINAMQPGDYVSSADLGQWALNVIERDSQARITVADFRAATASMQASIDRAGRAQAGPTPVPTTAPGAVGTRANPAGVGIPLSVTVSWFGQKYDVTASVQAVIRGAVANQMVKAANLFNADPKPGTEYVLVSIRLTYVRGPTADTAYEVSDYAFDVISTQGAEYEKPFCSAPAPKFGTTLYAGATTDGYGCYAVNQTDPRPTIVFGRNGDGTGGAWWRLGW